MKLTCWMAHIRFNINKTTKFPQSLMIWGCMSGKGTGEMTVVNSSINAQVYIDILDSFLIPSIEQIISRQDNVFLFAISLQSH
uniref:Uncharacterized protein n=1 Tax=Xiphophorus maculatus TaxID=8083 RepID=A0A3B5RAA9_XIPMA